MQADGTPAVGLRDKPTLENIENAVILKLVPGGRFRVEKLFCPKTASVYIWGEHNIRNDLQRDAPLKGWKEIAEFLGQLCATTQHWAKAGMPVTREGRYVTASREQLARWVSKESGMQEPVHIARAGDRDLLTELKRGVTAAQNRRKIHRVK